MISVSPLIIDNKPFTATQVKLPKTNLLIISNEVGYVMCGALDVDLLSNKLAERKIVAARAVGVKTIEALLDAPLDKVTTEAENFGWREGMNTKEALLKIAE
ncbi:YunC family protein [Radiobacillus sp. PE A8.2]|uniref:YunC family protein n=1 Tax=Radiobacillus sp. PE A8.2 TaxID=3380349 RepID=UPI00388F6CBC